MGAQAGESSEARGAQAAGMDHIPGSDWRWLAGFCVARGLFSMVQTTYSASLALLAKDWGMTAQQSGLISSAHSLGFLVSLFAVGILADRFGARRIYLLSSGIAVLSALAFAAFARDFQSGLLLHGLLGLASGGSYTPGLAILSLRFPPRHRGRAIGFYIAASSAGYAFSMLVSSRMIPLGGWPLAFWATMMGPLAGMVLGAWMLREVPNVIPPPPENPADAGMVGAVLRNRPALLIIGAYVFHSWELLGLWAWIPYYLATVYGGGGNVQAASMGATFSAITYMVSVGGPILGGALSDRLGRARVILLFAGLSAACSFFIGWLAALPFGLVVAVALVYQFAGIADSPVLSVAVTELVTPRYLGAAYALRSVLGFGAGAVSPWLFGVVLDWGRAGYSAPVAWGASFSLLGVGGVLAVAFTLKLHRRAALK